MFSNIEILLIVVESTKFSASCRYILLPFLGFGELQAHIILALGSGLVVVADLDFLFVFPVHS